MKIIEFNANHKAGYATAFLYRDGLSREYRATFHLLASIGGLPLEGFYLLVRLVKPV